MNRQTLAAISRSEMPKSVLLSYLLEMPSFLTKLRQSGVFQNQWWMRPIDGGDKCEFAGSLDEAKIMTGANFHVRRDLSVADESFVEQYGLGTPKNEIDVVAVIEHEIAIGFELKWKSPTWAISKQISEERECLTLIARYYNCRFSSMVAVLPTAKLVQEADAVITLSSIHQVIAEMSKLSNHSFMQRAEREFAVTKPTESWDIVGDVESLLARADSSPGNEVVGYQKGLSHLRQCSIPELKERPHWKIRSGHPNENWFPIGEVANIIRQKLARTPEG